MQVQVKNSLLCTGSAVEDAAIIRHTTQAHDIGCRQEHAPNEVGVSGGNVRNARNDGLGDNKKVNGRLRREVVDDDVPVVLELDIGRDLAGDDTLEERGVGGGHG